MSICSTEELERYLNEDEGPVLVEQYVTKMDTVSTFIIPQSPTPRVLSPCQIRKVHSDRDKLFADNEDQAGLNLRCEPDMQEAWTQLQEKVTTNKGTLDENIHCGFLQFLEMQALKTDYERMLEEQKQLTEVGVYTL